MTPQLLADLAHLFSLEACEADARGDDAEGDRLCDISSVLHARAEAAERHETEVAEIGFSRSWGSG